VFGGPREDNMGMLVLRFNALDLLSEDDEESPLCRSEAPLSLALYCFGSVPTFHMAWQH
jgi:hypothetical protein